MPPRPTERPGGLFWLPRTLAVGYAAFLAVFALDVFTPGAAFGPTLIALLMYLWPSALLVAALVLAWRRPGVGAACFLGLALVWLGVSRGEARWVGVPVAVIGALFGLEAWLSGRHRERPHR